MGLITDSPCMSCERRGCGAYHDECKKYLEYNRNIKDINNKSRTKAINTWSQKHENWYTGFKTFHKSMFKSHKK